MAEDVRRFVHTTVQNETNGKQRRVHLLGHSMGGKVAMYFALLPEGGELLQSLIVEDIAPRVYEFSGQRSFADYINAMKGVDLSKSRSEIGEDLSRTVTDMQTMQFLLMNLVKDERDSSRLRWKLNLDGILSNLRELSGSSLPRDASFVGPCLFVSGGNSTYCTSGDYVAIKRRFPQAVFETIDGSGHWIHAEKPYEFLEVIQRFLLSVTQRLE
ncbi:hypothetical protein AB6A40_000589 [Gnathostoma spinigerum]|uniref:sn-1-specific diacylglycerol lipase ABHD11 n=1 Tax=Gnathostoma spinigerum TaxID=75299 RepID=A0ABD6E2E6_9BILA